MAIICPTVLAKDPHDFREQMERIEGFAKRIQIDLTDGKFAPNKTLNPIQIYWPDGIQADIHLMFQEPKQHIKTLISLNPNLIILHGESDGDLKEFISEIKEVGIKTGLAILQSTQAQDVKELIELVDHVLIFGGNLGHYGGSADLTQLGKIDQIKAVKDVEIGWDGGANDENTAKLAASGVDVINVGGFIQKADVPQDAYAILERIVNREN